MAIEINLISPLPPDRVLDAIREDAREWRESKIPRDIWDLGVLQMRANVEPPKFKLWLDRRWQQGDSASLRVTGTVVARADGGSDITGRCTRHSPTWLVWAVIFAAAAVYDIARRALGYPGSGDWWIYLLLAVLMFVIDQFTDWRSSRDDPEATYLIGRLTNAVTSASQVAAKDAR